jgi:peptidoglycan hydrolase-like protein with peptidoglycan-binding domain
VTFVARNHGTGGKLVMATEAWCLAQPGPSPGPLPGPAPTGRPGPVGPEPELGGWQSDVAFVKRYQAALSYLAVTKNQPTWNPQAVDGSAGPNTQAAARAFQSANGITPVDGEVGSGTASVIDTLLGYGSQVPPGGYPPPSAGGGGGGGGGLPSSYQS